jgi:hypothetical protein
MERCRTLAPNFDAEWLKAVRGARGQAAKLIKTNADQMSHRELPFLVLTTHMVTVSIDWRHDAGICKIKWPQ